jgi:hypothetical protein
MLMLMFMMMFEDCTRNEDGDDVPAAGNYVL